MEAGEGALIDVYSDASAEADAVGIGCTIFEGDADATA